MEQLTKEEKQFFKNLKTPAKIQDFLNSIPFNFEKQGQTLQSPRRTLQNKTAHCVEGALFAAAVLQFHGEKPLLLDLKSTKKDFDHVVALFKREGRWGAISKTNHAVLRYREPVYKTVRELALSYFHEYFLEDGTKTLRSFSKPFNLKQFGNDWITATEDLWEIGATLDDAPHDDILTKSLLKTLRKADLIEIKAGQISEYKNK